MSESNDVLKFGDDDGYKKVEVSGTEINLDLYEVQNKIAAIAESVKGQPATAFHAKVAAYMVELGFRDGISHRMADRFAAGIDAEVRTLEKKTEGDAESPDSTGATPMDGATENLRDLIPQ